DRPPRALADAGQMLAALGGPTPQSGAAPEAVIEELVRLADPGLCAPSGERFFGWVIGGSHPAGVAADILTSAWGQNSGLVVATPAAAVAETVAGAWMLDMMRLPAGCTVGFVTGATMANFTALAAARHRVLAKTGWDVETEGLNGAPKVRIFIGEAAHATVFSALRYLGFGRALTLIAADTQGRMDSVALRKALRASRGPAIVIGQAGQINTGAFDPAAELADASAEAGAWFHVDGAFGLWARAVPRLDALTEGLDRADSWAVDGHKWLQLPYDSGFAIVRDREAHCAAMGLAASYLTPAHGEVLDPMLLVPELSRRARGFAAWTVLKVFGREGVVELVDRHCRLAAELARRLAAMDGVEVINEVVLNQVIVGFGDGPGERRDRLTRAVIDQLQADGECLAGGAAWNGRWVLRLSLISYGLQVADIDRLVNAIGRAWTMVRQAEERRPAPEILSQ
ncbi:MAG TPA: pyridoxal-dependent decarboxylase, partial [Caulobacteraceae bacterium]|nr:pyridoxal-dependent decarboxylase [Caulobacteraceae bacterium]